MTAQTAEFTKNSSCAACSCDRYVKESRAGNFPTFSSFTRSTFPARSANNRKIVTTGTLGKDTDVGASRRPSNSSVSATRPPILATPFPRFHPGDCEPTMIRLSPISIQDWNHSFATDVRQVANGALEIGQVLFFPNLNFELTDAEKRFLSPSILARSKNVSFNSATNEVRGTSCEGRDADDLKALMQRYADASFGLLRRLLLYGPALTRGRTSLRPAEVEGRVTSWRRDDRLLHVDSFPSMPMQGRRILRIFCNVNPNGRPRTWRIGEPFPWVAKYFWPRMSAPNWFKQRLLSWLHVTKGIRTEYDHYMLQLHDAMKADSEYQRSAAQETIDFPAGSAWACFTDQVSHAAVAGQFQFEQTFTVPVEAMQSPNTSPLSVLEQLAGRTLVTRQLRPAAAA